MAPMRIVRAVSGTAGNMEKGQQRSDGERDSIERKNHVRNVFET
jgi:hypothetical protein